MGYTTDFEGRTVLVTGASGGIGGETVRQLAAAGADVVAGGRSEETLNALAGETGARPLPFDLTSEDSVRNALDGFDLYGVVNCGGYGGESLDLSDESNHANTPGVRGSTGPRPQVRSRGGPAPMRARSGWDASM